MRPTAISSWFARLHRPVSLRSSNPHSLPPDRTPAWEDLRLETSRSSDGLILDLSLSCRGLSTARCVVARKGAYLVEPTGPVWARQLLQEAVREWCELDSEMN